MKKNNLPLRKRACRDGSSEGELTVTAPSLTSAAETFILEHCRETINFDSALKADSSFFVRFNPKRLALVLKELERIAKESVAITVRVSNDDSFVNISMSLSDGASFKDEDIAALMELFDAYTLTASQDEITVSLSRVSVAKISIRAITILFIKSEIERYFFK